MVAGWTSSGRVQVPRRCSSWTAPLRMDAAGAPRGESEPGRHRADLLVARAGAARPARRSTAHLELRRRLRLRPVESGLDRRARLPAGALAGGPLLLRRSHEPAPDGPTAPAGGQVRLRRPDDLAGADGPVVHRRSAVWPRPAAGLEWAAPHPTAACREGHPRAAARPPAGARHAPPPGGGPPPPSHQNARAPVVLVVGPPGVPKASAHCLLNAFQRSNSRLDPPCGLPFTDHGAYSPTAMSSVGSLLWVKG